MRSSISDEPSGKIALTALRRITAVIVTYNGTPYIEGCLRSLFEASEERPQVVIVDNASTDGTVDIVRRGFPEVRILISEQNLGYGMACNAGVLDSESEFIAVVNQDVVVTPGWIERIVKALDGDSLAAMATPKILLRRDPGRINACGNEPHYTGITTCRGYDRPSQEFTGQEEVAAVSGAAFVVRRTVFEDLGGFDPSFFLYLEDTELSLRASLAGYRNLCVAESVVLHDFGQSFSAEKIFFLERNRHIMLLKTYRWRTMLILTPALLLTELAVLGYSLLHGPHCLWSKLLAYSWVLRHMPRILSARRQVQALRRVSDGALVSRCTAELELEELGHPLGKLAMALINPLFRVWYRVALEVV